MLNIWITEIGIVLGVGMHHSNLSRCKNTASSRRTIYRTIKLSAILYELYASGICDLWHCFGFAYHNKRDMHFYYRNRCVENQRSCCTVYIESGFETVSEKKKKKYHANSYKELCSQLVYTHGGLLFVSISVFSISRYSICGKNILFSYTIFYTTPFNVDFVAFPHECMHTHVRKHSINPINWSICLIFTQIYAIRSYIRMGCLPY